MSGEIKTAGPITIWEEEGPQLDGQAAAIARIEEGRAVQEAQAQFIVAKRFPRNELEAERKIVEACKRQSLAQVAEYSYSRGGSAVRGASIRLAEAMARHWGNIRFGFRELSQAGGVSEIQAYAIDMETNTLQERVFQVKHVRYSKTGGMQRLTDPRDIYEMIANLAARRIRACLLSLIPGDVQDAALQQCEATLRGGGGTPLKDRIKKMLETFKELGVSQAMIEARYRKKAESIDEIQLLDLIRIHNSLRDGMSNPEEWFSDENVSAKQSLKKAAQKGSGSPKTEAGPTPGPPAEDPTRGQEEGEDTLYEKQGRISSEEDKEYIAKWQDLLHQAVACGKTEDFAVKVMERLSASHGGAQGPVSIRNRERREKFLKDWSDMVEQWVKNADSEA